MKYRAKMYAHRLIDWQGEGPGLTGAYYSAGCRLSDLSLFQDRVESEEEAKRINEDEEMALVEVVEVQVTIEIGARP